MTIDHDIMRLQFVAFFEVLEDLSGVEHAFRCALIFSSEIDNIDGRHHKKSDGIISKVCKHP